MLILFAGDVCYFLQPSKDRYSTKSWHEAEDICRNTYGAHLASINSRIENIVVMTLIKSDSYRYYDFWIGLNCFERQLNEWNWIDGSPVLNIRKYLHETETTKHYRCVYTDSSGVWNRRKCNEQDGRYICRRDFTIPNTTVAPPISGGCQDGWYESQHNRCFKFFPDKSLSKDDADTFCKTLNASLPAIHNNIEQYFMAQMMSNFHTNVWLGMSRQKWEDESPVSFTNWAPGEPKSTYQFYCAYMMQGYLHAGKWGTNKCDEQLNVICEKSMFGMRTIKQ